MGARVYTGNGESEHARASCRDYRQLPGAPWSIPKTCGKAILREVLKQSGRPR